MSRTPRSTGTPPTGGGPEHQTGGTDPREPGNDTPSPAPGGRDESPDQRVVTERVTKPERGSEDASMRRLPPPLYTNRHKPHWTESPPKGSPDHQSGGAGPSGARNDTPSPSPGGRDESPDQRAVTEGVTTPDRYSEDSSMRSLPRPRYSSRQKTISLPSDSFPPFTPSAARLKNPPSILRPALPSPCEKPLANRPIPIFPVPFPPAQLETGEASRSRSLGSKDRNARCAVPRGWVNMLAPGQFPYPSEIPRHGTENVRTIEHYFAGYSFQIQTDAKVGSKRLRVKRVNNYVEYYCSGVLLTKIKYKLEGDIFSLYEDPDIHSLGDAKLCEKIEILIAPIVASLFKKPWRPEEFNFKWGIRGCDGIGDGNFFHVDVIRNSDSWKKHDPSCQYSQSSSSTQSRPDVPLLDAFHRVPSVEIRDRPCSGDISIDQSRLLEVLRQVELLTAMELGKKSYLTGSAVASVIGRKDCRLARRYNCNTFSTEVPTLFGLIVSKLRRSSGRSSQTSSTHSSSTSSDFRDLPNYERKNEDEEESHGPQIPSMVGSFSLPAPNLSDASGAHARSGSREGTSLDWQSLTSGDDPFSHHDLDSGSEDDGQGCSNRESNASREDICISTESKASNDEGSSSQNHERFESQEIGTERIVFEGDGDTDLETEQPDDVEPKLRKKVKFVDPCVGRCKSSRRGGWFKFEDGEVDEYNDPRHEHYFQDAAGNSYTYQTYSISPEHPSPISSTHSIEKSYQEAVAAGHIYGALPPISRKHSKRLDSQLEIPPPHHNSHGSEHHSVRPTKGSFSQKYKFSDSSPLPTPATWPEHSGRLSRKRFYKSMTYGDMLFEESLTPRFQRRKKRMPLLIGKDALLVTSGVIILILSILAFVFDPAAEDNWFKRMEEGGFVMFSLGIPLLIAMRQNVTDNLEIKMPKLTRKVRTMQDLENLNNIGDRDVFLKQLQRELLFNEELSMLFSPKDACYKLSRKSGNLVVPEAAAYTDVFKEVWLFGEQHAYNKILGKAFRYEERKNVLMIENESVDIEGVIVHARRRRGRFTFGSNLE